MNVFRLVVATWAATVLSACQGPSPAGEAATESIGLASGRLNSGTVCVTLSAGSPGVARDAELRQDHPNTSYGSQNVAQVGVPGAGERRMLLWFDVSSIPAGAPISSATVMLGGGNASFGSI